jgi:hypothetical protein
VAGAVGVAAALVEALKVASLRFGVSLSGSGTESSGVCAGGLSVPTLP